MKGIRGVDVHGGDTDGTAAGGGVADDGPWIQGARPSSLVELVAVVAGGDDEAAAECGHDALSHRPCTRVPMEPRPLP